MWKLKAGHKLRGRGPYRRSLERHRGWPRALEFDRFHKIEKKSQSDKQDTQSFGAIKLRGGRRPPRRRLRGGGGRRRRGSSAAARRWRWSGGRGRWVAPRRTPSARFRGRRL